MKRIKQWAIKLKNKLPSNKFTRSLPIVFSVFAGIALTYGIIHLAEGGSYSRIQADDSQLCWRKPDTTVKAKYPITGYFSFTSSDPCTTQSIVEKMHQIGADTVLTFGATLRPVSFGTLRSSHPNFRNSSGQHGVDIANATVGGRIKRAFLYQDKLHLDHSLLSCPGRRGIVRTSNGGSYTWYVTPSDESVSYSTCNSPSGSYDLIVNYNYGSNDANTAMVKTARRYGMKVYLGLPKPEMMPGAHGKLTYPDYKRTTGLFTQIVLKSWHAKYGNDPSFVGVYQTTETVLSQKISKRVLDLYAMQNRIVGYSLSDSRKQVVISPYARLLRSSGVSLGHVTNAAKQIGATGSGTGATVIISPQDGAGTGYVGLYDPYELYSTKRYAARIAPPAGGGGTNVSAYSASTRELYEATARSGYRTWATVEVFKPGGVQGTRPRSDRSTIDKQVRSAAPYVQKIVAYRWHRYMDFGSTPKTNMYRSISNTGERPMIAKVQITNTGLRITGYNLVVNNRSSSVLINNGKIKKYRIYPGNVATAMGGRMQIVNINVPINRGKPVYAMIYNAGPSGKNRTNTLAGQP